MKRSSFKRLALSIMAIATLSNSAVAQVRLPHLIGDGMVLQRQAEVPIWGWADAGTEIRVTFRDQTYGATADSAGEWRVELPPMDAGGPFTMSIAANDSLVRISDILIGDVWLCSGQSNMEWVVRDVNHADEEIADADDSMIRHFKVPRSWAWMPEDELAGGSWEAASPATVANFTAVGYFFAREIRKHVDVPIGLINSSWGGSRIEPWMNARTLGLGEEGAMAIQERIQQEEEAIRARLKERIGQLPDTDRGFSEGKPVWAAEDLDDSDWDTLAAPGLWEQAGYDGMDGIGWLRTTFELTPEQASAGASLGLGMIDDSDIVWLNGREIGRTENAYNLPRVYQVAPEILKQGANVIAIRVEDTGGGGGIHGSPDLLFVESGGDRQSLAGDWLFNVGAVSVNLDGRKNQVPTILYNKMIHPMQDYPIAGALWYQGESNAGPDEAHEYRDLFKDMITQWRQEWGVGDFPFLFVQLANYMAAQPEPVESSWAVLRESQGDALTLPNTAQAVIIDIGDPGDIHPRNKQDVGLRLSLAARKLKYGQDVEHSGPVFLDAQFRDGRAYLQFAHVADGLELRDLPDGVTGFAVAGDDRQFHWAEAELEDGKVVVSSEHVPNPVAVRYAWADNPVGANLYNSEGLPASPFRTDDW